MTLSLLNQLVMFGVLHLVWLAYEATAGASAFSAELPSLVTVLINVLCFLPIADFFFYFPHKLLHSNAWLFQHVHAIHHRLVARARRMLSFPTGACATPCSFGAPGCHKSTPDYTRLHFTLPT